MQLGAPSVLHFDQIAAKRVTDVGFGGKVAEGAAEPGRSPRAVWPGGDPFLPAAHHLREESWAACASQDHGRDQMKSFVYSSAVCSFIMK